MPHKTYIPHLPASVYLGFLQPKYTSVGSFSWHYFPSLTQSQVFLQIVIKKYYNLTCLQRFLTPAIFFKEMEPVFVIRNISIATDEDITQFGDTVNIYHVYLSRAIIIRVNCLNWLAKTIFLDHSFC